MIVNRRTFIVKKGCATKVVDLLRTVTEGFSQPKVFRIYEWYISPSDQVIWEAEFEDLEAYSKFSAEWMSGSKRDSILDQFADLTVSGGSSEIWKLTT